MKNYFFILWICFAHLSAEASETLIFQQIPEEVLHTELDPSPYISTRAGGMSHALSPVADGVHAPFYNPAGIGGIHWGKKTPSSVRQFYLPYLGVAANTQSSALYKEMRRSKNPNNTTFNKAIVSAHAGHRQYGRSSAIVSFSPGRMTLLQYTDTQIAAFQKAGSDSIRTHYQSRSGFGFGMSLASQSERLYLGAFSAIEQLSLVNQDFSFEEISNMKDRNDSLKRYQKSYSGVPLHLGMIWVISNIGRPALSIVSKHNGGTLYTANDKKISGIKKPQNLTLGFSFSPYVGKTGAFNFVVEGERLTETDISLSKKFRTGLELNLGGFGSDAPLSLRAGASLAGVSAGINLNIGLIQLEYASQAEDVGLDNRHMIERRNVFVASINVTDE